MAQDVDPPFKPNWASAPGETVRDFLQEQGSSVEVLARQMGLTVTDAMALLDGRMRIDEELAETLTMVVGSSASFWLRRDEQFEASLQRLHRTREGHAKREHDKRVAAQLIWDVGKNPNDEPRCHVNTAALCSLIDELHDELEVLRKDASQKGV